MVCMCVFRFFMFTRQLVDVYFWFIWFLNYIYIIIICIFIDTASVMGSSAALFLLFSSLRVNGCFENGNQRAAWLAKLVLCGNHIAIQSITLQNLFTSLITKVELQGWKDNQNLLSNVYDFNKTPLKDPSWFFCLLNLIIFSNDYEF